MTEPTTEQVETDPKPSLVADQRGAVMVMGVFMAVLLVGMIYYVTGIGETILYRERMQDAADSGAFAAAVIHARGMNILALINIIMASVIAVLVALQVLEDLLTAALAVATAICAGCSCPGCCGCCLACPFVPVLEEGRSFVSGVRDAAEPPIETILELLHTGAVAIREGYPYVAQAKVYELGEDTYSDPTELGFMYPFLPELPVEDDDSDLLCRKAGEQAGRIDASLLGLWPIRMFVGTAVGGLAATFSDHYCGDGAQYAQRVVEDVELGDEEFQVRAFMIGDPPFRQNEAGVAVATWGTSNEADSYELLENLGKVSFAQAEFYLDNDAPHEEWLWHMDWKARLHRFRLPDFGGIGAFCDSGACGALSGITNIDSIVVH